MSFVVPADVRPRLNKSSTVDDVEIQAMIDAAEAEFEEVVCPLGVTSYTETHSGPVAVLRHRDVLTVDLVADTYGTTVDSSVYALNGPAGVLAINQWGTFTVTYTAGHATPPANWVEVIIADVAGYFARTQRGGSANRPSFPGDDFAEGAPQFDSGPLSMWPRIAALAARRGPVIA